MLSGWGTHGPSQTGTWQGHCPGPKALPLQQPPPALPQDKGLPHAMSLVCAPPVCSHGTSDNGWAGNQRPGLSLLMRPHIPYLQICPEPKNHPAGVGSSPHTHHVTPQLPPAHLPSPMATHLPNTSQLQGHPYWHPSSTRWHAGQLQDVGHAQGKKHYPKPTACSRSITLTPTQTLPQGCVDHHRCASYRC